MALTSDQVASEIQNTMSFARNEAYSMLSASTDMINNAVSILYDDLLRTKIATERDKAVQAVDDATVAAGWDLPGLARAAGQKRIQQDSASNLNNAALEVYVKRADRELQHLQFIMQVVPPLQASAVALFGQAWGMQMQAFDGALRFADTAVKFAHAVYALKQRDFEIEQGLLESQIRIFEALLKAELAKAEITKQQLEVEQLKESINKDQIELYTAQPRQKQQAA